MASLSDIQEKYVCVICQEIFENPSTLSCHHTFCFSCISHCASASTSPNCPVCRVPFKLSSVEKDRCVLTEMESTLVPCSHQGCNVEVHVSKLRAHEKKCAFKKEESVSHARGPKDPNYVNRSTFDCPFCKQVHNLTCKMLWRAQELVLHVRARHGRDGARSGVCPVCAAMPWGDKNYKSANLLQHMNMRHKFEYDTYADFGQDEEAVLREVMQKSLSER